MEQLCFVDKTSIRKRKTKEKVVYNNICITIVSIEIDFHRWKEDHHRIITVIHYCELEKFGIASERSERGSKREKKV